jgi:RimJ/RimL family protein N-acetyltransferase
MPRTKPFTIRPFEYADVERQRAWPRFVDPLLLSYNLSVPPGGEQQYMRTRCQLPGYMRWAVDDHRRRLLAVISLREIDQAAGCARLGITVRPDRLGHGYGRDILRRFLVLYFRELGFATMILDVAAANQRAIHCYLRLGFQTVGSHWRLHTAASDPAADRHYRHLAEHFRRNGDRLEVRFLDMQMDLPRFLQVNPDLADAFQKA